MANLNVVISGDAAGLKLAISNAAVSLVELGATSQQAASAINAAMGRADANVGQLNKSLDTSQSLMGKLAGLAAGVISVAAIVSLAKEASALNLALERANNTLRFASGSTAAYAANNEFLRTTVRALGLDLQSAGQQFASLTAAAKGTALEGAGTRSIFDAVAKASTVMGLTADQTAGSLLAVSQMISKGTVSAEELRGQLGERLPGAFQTAARAMGVTTAELGKMLESGSLATDVFLPRFAAQMRQDMGASVEDAANSVQANLNRVKTDWANLVTVVNNSAFTNETLKGIDQFLTVLTGTLQKSKDDFKGWGDSVANTLAFVGDAAASAIRMIGALGSAYGGAATLASLYVQRLSDIDKAGFYADRDKRVAAIEANYAASTQAVRDGMNKVGQALVSGSSALRDGLDKQRAEIAAAAADPELKRLAEKARTLRNDADRALLATKPVLGGGKGTKEAASAYDSLANAIGQAEQMAQAELATGEKLNAADKFRITTLDKLQAAYAGGKITFAQWDRLYDNTIAAADARAVADDSSAFNKHMAGLREGNALLQQELDTGEKYSAAQLKALKILQEMTDGTRVYSEAQAIALGLELERSILLERANAQRKAQLSLDDKAFDSLAKEVAKLREGNATLALHNQEIGLSAEALASLKLARLDDGIAIQQGIVFENADIAAREGATAAMQLEIGKLDELKRQRALTASGQTATLAADTAKAATVAAKAAQKAWEDTNKSIQDGLYNAIADGGDSALKKLLKDAKEWFARLVLRPIIQPIGQFGASLSNPGAAGGLGGLGGGGGAGGLGDIGSLASLAGSNFGAGLTTGFLEAFSAGGSGLAGGLELGVGLLESGAIAGGLGALAGVLGPIGLGLAALNAIVPGGIFGGSQEQVDSQGISGKFGPDGFSGNNFSKWHRQGGWFETSSSGNNLSALEAGQAKGLNDTFTGLRTQASVFAEALGLSSAGIKTFTKDIELAMGGDKEANKRVIEGAMQTLGNDLAKQALGTYTTTRKTVTEEVGGGYSGGGYGDLGQWQSGTMVDRVVEETTYTASKFARAGEAAFDTLKRLGGSLMAANTVLDTLDLRLYAVSLAGGELASKLVDAAGGLEAFAAKTANYYDKFYSDEEKLANTREAATLALAKAGLGALPASHEAYRKLVQAQDLNTDAGRAGFAVLMDTATAFDQVATAADQVAKSVKSLVDSLFDEVRRIRGEVAGTGTQGFAYAQAQFAIGNARAQAGDQAAMKLLPELSRTMLALAEGNATSLIELRRIQAGAASALTDTAATLTRGAGGGVAASAAVTPETMQILVAAALRVASGGLFGAAFRVPSFAVGTDYVPRDMLAMVHKGERITPAAYNNDNGNAELVAEIRALRQEVAALRESARETSQNTWKAADVLVRSQNAEGDALSTRAVA